MADNKVESDPVTTADESSHKDKQVLYKALAIKLKKELLKTREELSKLKENYHNEVDKLKEEIDTVTKTLESEKVIRANNETTLEATIRNLKNQLAIAEDELQSLQKDFDAYKTRATKLLQQTNPSQSNQNKAFEEERIIQLQALNDEQNKQLDTMRQQFKDMSAETDRLKCEILSVNQKLESVTSQAATLKENNSSLTSENENLRSMIEQMNLKSRFATKIGKLSPRVGSDADLSDTRNKERDKNLEFDGEEPTLDEANINSNSSEDSSTSGYVHIKPTTFEIVSRSSVLEDAQNQIDDLTKAYLDSENTNSLLKEQVDVLKEEIRRIQRGNDRIELVNNLEYLKNILFKYLSLDSSQVEQRRRLIPVLSTVLKLSPEEANKLR